MARLLIDGVETEPRDLCLCSCDSCFIKHEHRNCSHTRVKCAQFKAWVRRQ